MGNGCPNDLGPETCFVQQSSEAAQGADIWQEVRIETRMRETGGEAVPNHVGWGQLNKYKHVIRACESISG